jgi:hypothetical protein
VIRRRASQGRAAGALDKKNRQFLAKRAGTWYCFSESPISPATVSRGRLRRQERIAFGSTRPIVAALGKRGYAVNDRVYKVRLDGTAICSNNSERVSDSEMARQAIKLKTDLRSALGRRFLSQPARRGKVARKRS